MPETPGDRGMFDRIDPDKRIQSREEAEEAFEERSLQERIRDITTDLMLDENSDEAPSPVMVSELLFELSEILQYDLQSRELAASVRQLERYVLGKTSDKPDLEEIWGPVEAKLSENNFGDFAKRFKKFLENRINT